MNPFQEYIHKRIYKEKRKYPNRVVIDLHLQRTFNSDDIIDELYRIKKEGQWKILFSTLNDRVTYDYYFEKGISFLYIRTTEYDDYDDY